MGSAPARHATDAVVERIIDALSTAWRTAGSVAAWKEGGVGSKRVIEGY